MDCPICGPMPRTGRVRAALDFIRYMRMRSPAVVRWFRWLRWIDVVVFFLIGWFSADCLFEGSVWYTIGIWGINIVITSIVMLFDPPNPSKRFWHAFLRHTLPRTIVPILGINAVFQYNWSGIVRLIGGVIGVASLATVLFLSHNKRRRAVIAILEAERELWVTGIRSQFDQRSGQALLDFYREH